MKYDTTGMTFAEVAALESKAMRKRFPHVAEQTTAEVASEPILRLLADGISYSNREMCELLEVSQQTMSLRLGRLLRAGAIKYDLRPVDYSNQNVRFYKLAATP